MKITKIWFGFWLGVAFISLINIMLNLLNKNQSAYNLYIFTVSIIVLIVALILSKIKKK